MNKLIIDASEYTTKPNGIYTQIEVTGYRIVEEPISTVNLGEEARNFDIIIDHLKNKHSSRFKRYIEDCVEVNEPKISVRLQ